MQSATASEIIGILGEVESLTLEKLLATGASVHEIGNAIAAIEDEDSFGEERHAPSSQREAEVRAVLEELVFDSIDERESEGELAHT